MGEFDLIEAIRTRTALRRDDVRLGIGDDAALLAPPLGHLLASSIDTLVAGVHFPVGTAAEDLGWKALAVNLSDLAAMGATPAWALLALTLPAADARFVERFADGFAELARMHSLALVGGDTTQGPLSISVAVHGFVPAAAALTRAGAHAGDLLLVTGTLGDAAAGLVCLDRQHARANALLAAPNGTREALLERLHRPTPRVAAGQALRGVASACIDVSDGLLADLGHLCTASGVGAEIDAATLPLSSALMTLFDDEARLGFALTGGDDYELCFSVAPERVGAATADLARLGCGVTRIGRIVAAPGVHVQGADGRELVPPRRGYEHFAR